MDALAGGPTEPTQGTARDAGGAANDCRGVGERASTRGSRAAARDTAALQQPATSSSPPHQASPCRVMGALTTHHTAHPGSTSESWVVDCGCCWRG